MKEITVYGLHIAKKTGVIGTIVIFSAVLSLGLNMLLIPLWDITGAAVATLVTQLAYWLACYYFSQKVFPVPYELGKIANMVIIGMCISFGLQYFNHVEIIPRLLIKLAGVLSFPLILKFTGFYEPAEMAAISGFFRKWSRLSMLGENIRSLKNIRDELQE